MWVSPILLSPNVQFSQDAFSRADLCRILTGFSSNANENVSAEGDCPVRTSQFCRF